MRKIFLDSSRNYFQLVVILFTLVFNPYLLSTGIQSMDPDFGPFKTTLDVCSGAMNTDFVDIFKIIWMPEGTSKVI